MLPFVLKGSVRLNGSRPSFTATKSAPGEDFKSLLEKAHVVL